MKQRTRFLATLLAILMLLSVTPITSLASTTTTETYGGTFGAEGDNLTWKIENNTLTISGTGEMTEDYGFDNAPWYNYRNSFNKVVIEEGILNIGRYSFFDCDYIEEISFPNTVTTIYEKAISDCEKLKYIFIPESVSSIESPLFHACNKVERINVDKDNQWLLADESGVLFDKNKTILYHYPPNNTATHYDIPETVNRIGYNAFYSNIHLKSVQMSDNVSVIDNWAFMFCESLETINLPKSLTKISGQCFTCCFSLTDVEIPENVTTIDYYAFSSCKSLKTISIHKNITSIATDAFDSCNGVETITVAPDNPIYHSENNCLIETATKTLVRGCKNSIIPTDGSVECIGAHAFYGTSSLTTIKIPDTVSEIGDYAFYRTSELKHIGYLGTEEEWNSVEIGTNNDSLQDVEYMHFNFNPETDMTIATIEPSCTTTGTQIYTCSCGYSLSVTIPKTEHVYNTTITSPTCAEQGYTTYICECGDTYVSDFEDAIGHSYTSAITVPATHLTEGIMTYTCACGDTYTEAISKTTEHTYDAVVTAPTCTEQGYTTYTCECGDSYVSDYVDANGHDYTSVITKEATHLEEGIKTFTCFCGDSYTETIAKIDAHDYKADTTEPTCTKQGFTTYTCECGDSYVSDYVDAVGHDLTGWVNDEENGTAARECSRCDYIETVPLTNQGDGNVEIIAPENPEIDFEIDNIETNSDQFIVIEKIVTDNLRTDWKVIKAFDITLKNSDGVHVQPGGIVKVKLPLDWEKDGNYKVYRVNDDGTLTDMNAYRQGSHMVFDTDHFSIYVIVEEIVQEEKPSTEKLSFFDFINNIVNCFKNIITSIINFFRSIGDYT